MGEVDVPYEALGGRSDGRLFRDKDGRKLVWELNEAELGAVPLVDKCVAARVVRRVSGLILRASLRIPVLGTAFSTLAGKEPLMRQIC